MATYAPTKVKDTKDYLVTKFRGEKEQMSLSSANDIVFRAALLFPDGFRNPTAFVTRRLS